VESSDNAAPNILGESNNHLALHTPEDYHFHIVSLINQSKRIIQIYSCDLPNVIFANQEVTAALSDFVRKHRHVNIEVLLKDTRLLIQKRPPLLNLNNRLSAMKIKKAHEDYCFGEQTILLFDRTAFVKKPEVDSQMGKVCYNDKADTRTQSLVFSEYWERSVDDPDLREQLI